MTPYYQDDAVTIYHGDCREVLPSLTFDVAITDPPYGTGHYEADNWVLDAGMFPALGPNAAVFGWPERLVRMCRECEVTPSGWITWWPTNGAAKAQARTGPVRETEHIALFGRWFMDRNRQQRSANARSVMATLKALDDTTKAPIDDRRTADVWRDASPGCGFLYAQRLHPNEKPLLVMKRLVVASDGVIADPFMGSGTTLRAAKDLGRKAIGIEIDERYCEIAARRMGQEVLAL